MENKDKKNKKTVGIIGCGVLGNTHRLWLKKNAPQHKVLCYDINSEIEGLTDFDTLIKQSDYIFINIPSNFDEKIKTLNINDIIETVKKIRVATLCPIIIRSTLPLKGLETIKEKTTFDNLYFWPEYLTERFAEKDFDKPWLTLFATPERGKENLKPAFDIFVELVAEDIIPRCMREIVISSRLAELHKLVTNSFYALRVTFANEVYDLCKGLGIDYEDLKILLCCDPRIGSDPDIDKSGYDVHFRIGQDGSYGFGGKCLPKDLSETVNFMKKNKLGFGLLEQVEKINNKIRRPIDK